MFLFFVLYSKTAENNKICDSQLLINDKIKLPTVPVSMTEFLVILFINETAFMNVPRSYKFQVRVRVRP